MHEPLSNVAWRQMQKQPALSCRRPTELNCLQGICAPLSIPA